jgi:ribosomal protein L40E
VRRTQIVHAWQEGDYAGPDSCHILDVCQRCGASQPGRVQHHWQPWRVEDETAQKCQRCGQVQLEWPELQADQVATTTVEIKDKIASVNETENVELQPLVAHWGPIVTHLLERIASVTAKWHEQPLQYTSALPLNIARSITKDNSIVWKIEHFTYTEFSGGSSYFTVTLAVSQDYEPLNFQVLSKSFRFRTEPRLEHLKAALVRACADGPAYWYGGIGGHSCSWDNVREENIPYKNEYRSAK